MSVGAKHWALAQKVEGGSAPRILLFYLADWIIGADQTECWPSVERLVFETGMNRKTIIKALSSLEEQNLITKRSVWVYDDNKNVPKRRNVFGLVGFVPSEWENSKRPSPEGESTEVPNLVRSKNGTSQKRNVPNLDSDSPKFGLRKSQIRTPIVPNLGHKQGDIQGDIQEEEQVFISRTSSTSAENNNDSIPDAVPSWVTDTPSSDSYSEATSTAGGSSVSDCGSAVSSREDTFELTPDEPPAKPAPKAKPKASRRKPKISCPFTPGDALSDDLLSWAAENYPTIDARAEFQNFINSALANDRRYSDWNAAFRNWCGNALRYQNQNGGNSARKPYKRDTTRFAHEWRQEDRVYGSEEGLKEMLAYLEEHGEKISA